MNQSIILLLLWLIPAYQTLAQYHPLPTFKSQWPDEKVEPLAVDSRFENSRAVILDDQLNVSVRGMKDDFIYIYFERKQRIKLQAPVSGQLPFSRILIPESHDPFFDGRNKPARFPIDSLVADYLEVKMVHFAARKILPNESTQEIGFSDEFLRDTIVINERTQTQFRYAFNLHNLQLGDEIEVHYKYEVPYKSNWAFVNSNRIFFNRNYPVQKQRIEITTPRHLATEISGVEPDKVFTQSKRTTRVWKNQNLEGNVAEVGIRPSEDLPHLIYSINIKSPRYNYRHPESGREFTAHYLLSLLRYHERNAFRIRSRALDNSGDWQTHQLKRFIETETLGIPQNRTALRFDKINTVIANDFTLLHDRRLYEGKDMSLEKVGDQVANKEMRESSRYHIYARLIYMLDIQYFTAYMLDSRIGTISDNYTSNIYFNDFSFAVPDENYLNLYFPKKDQFGYEVNEYPFYLAGTPAYLVDIDYLFFDPAFQPLVISLPGALDENYRHSEVRMVLNTTDHTALAKLETELTGQFSTLTRSLYDFGRIDSSINPLYNKKLFWGKEAVYTKTEKTLAGVYAPYRRKYNMEVSLAVAATQDLNSDYALPLNGWFNFVHWPEFDHQPRVLPFYPDFTGNDFVRIMINFDRGVELQNQEELHLSLQNRFGSVMFDVQQTSSNQITITAMHNIISEKVEPDKAHLISALYNGLKSLNEKTVKLNWAANADY